MPNEKEIGLLRPAKAPNINAPIEIQIRQISDSIKNINSAIRGLQEKMNELETAKLETFKYLKGRLSKERTAPNSDGEVELVSSNKTIDIGAKESVVDLRAKNAFDEFSAFTTPGATTGFVRVKIKNVGEYWIQLCSAITP